MSILAQRVNGLARMKLINAPYVIQFNMCEYFIIHQTGEINI